MCKNRGRSKDKLILEFFDINKGGKPNYVVYDAVKKFETTFKRVRELRSKWEKENQMEEPKEEIKEEKVIIKPDVYTRESRADEPLYKGNKRYLFVFNTDKLSK